MRTHLFSISLAAPLQNGEFATPRLNQVKVKSPGQDSSAPQILK